tara:strand:- start:2721 stop:2963 length:243 start_codon:yes stop_codon:yes gene_type:complete
MSRPLTRIDDPVSLFEEILRPFNADPCMPRRTVTGTKEKPTTIVRRELVERTYHVWKEEDGSYHEVVVLPEEADNYGGTK